ncbi:MAG: hypothetical protein AAB709_01550 [Patescibacteria group bacterium]|mgnify:FL=1
MANVILKERPKRDWWQKGRAFDLWSIPHFLFGVLTGFLPALTGLSFLTALALTLIFAMLWEVYEKFISVRETVQNSLFDIILPIASFTLTSYLLLIYPLHPDDLLVVASAVFIVYVFTNVSGWLAYRRRNRDFLR